jgi:hypothetical protein
MSVVDVLLLVGCLLVYGHDGVSFFLHCLGGFQNVGFVVHRGGFDMLFVGLYIQLYVFSKFKFSSNQSDSIPSMYWIKSVSKIHNQLWKKILIDLEFFLFKFVWLE